MLGTVHSHCRRAEKGLMSLRVDSTGWLLDCDMRERPVMRERWDCSSFALTSLS